MFLMMYSCLVGIVIRAFWLVPGKDLGSGSLQRAARHGALPAVLRHPVRAHALIPLQCGSSQRS
jgi:hypothetical protein